MTQLKLPRMSTLLLGYAAIAGLASVALVLFHGPAEPMILLIGPILFAALFYPRLAYITMLVLTILAAIWVTLNSLENFAASLRTIAVLFVLVVAMAETLRRSMIALNHTEETLRETNQLLQTLIGASPAAIVIIDPAGGVKMWSKAAEQIFGWGEEEVVGRPNPIVPKDKQEEFWEMQRQLRQGETYINFETRRQRKDGVSIDVSISTALLKDGRGQDAGAMAIITDVTEHKQAEEMIRHQAYHDSLTGLPNRLLFNDRLDQALARVRRNNQILALMFLDLDHFKSINDRLGHSAGDQLLQAVGRRLPGCLREDDTIARLGGDEFTLLLEIFDVDDVAKVAQRILAAFKTPFNLDGVDITLTTSIGISLFPYDGEDPQTLMKKADLALYRAKERGRNNYQCPAAEAVSSP